MNFFINQNIMIHYLMVGGITNSSVLQIGSAGIIKPVSHLYNTGGFTEAAPQLGQQEYVPNVPLPPPSPS